jgi:hypothetical protein
MFGSHLDHVDMATAAASASKLSQPNAIVGPEGSAIRSSRHRRGASGDYGFGCLSQEMPAIDPFCA